MPLDAETFRAVMRQVAQPVTVVTVRDAEGLHGMTASSFTSIALEPPLVMISVSESNATCRRIQAAGAFAVNVLGVAQQPIGAAFARPGTAKDAVFEHIAHDSAVTGAPIFPESVCWLDCAVYALHRAGSGVLFIGQVEAAGAGRARVPLLYRDRAYEAYEPERHDGADFAADAEAARRSQTEPVR